MVLISAVVNPLLALLFGLLLLLAMVLLSSSLCKPFFLLWLCHTVGHGAVDFLPLETILSVSLLMNLAPTSPRATTLLSYGTDQIVLNIEHRLMTQATIPCEYDPLTLMQKVEVFEMSLQHTAGQDLYKVHYTQYRTRHHLRTSSSLRGIHFLFCLRGNYIGSVSAS